MPAAKNSSNTASSLLSSPSSLPSPPSLPSPEALLDALVNARQRKIAAQNDEESLLDQLDQLVEAGEIDLTDPLSWNDWTISQRTRKTYRYPAHITEQRDALKAAEKLTVALGEAEVVITSFWEVRQPKP